MLTLAQAGAVEEGPLSFFVLFLAEKKIFKKARDESTEM
jgi:hypothetical protein